MRKLAARFSTSALKQPMKASSRTLSCAPTAPSSAKKTSLVCGTVFWWQFWFANWHHLLLWSTIISFLVSYLGGTTLSAVPALNSSTWTPTLVLSRNQPAVPCPVSQPIPLRRHPEAELPAFRFQPALELHHHLSVDPHRPLSVELAFPPPLLPALHRSLEANKPVVPNRDTIIKVNRSRLRTTRAVYEREQCFV